ncbi:MAG TPA: hypothetical protein VF827_03980, partial [Syntrophales bacterium]
MTTRPEGAQLLPDLLQVGAVRPDDYGLLRNPCGGFDDFIGNVEELLAGDFGGKNNTADRIHLLILQEALEVG